MFKSILKSFSELKVVLKKGQTKKEVSQSKVDFPKTDKTKVDKSSFEIKPNQEQIKTQEVRPTKRLNKLELHNQMFIDKRNERAIEEEIKQNKIDDQDPKDLHQYHRRHVVVTNTNLRDQKIDVYVGIDFGTSYTKAYFKSTKGTSIPVEWNDLLNGKEGTSDDDYFLPTRLYFDKKFQKFYFNSKAGLDEIKYFKYAMIKPELRNSAFDGVKSDEKEVVDKNEFLASVFFMANVLKLVRSYIAEKLNTVESRINYHINMGCPIENWRDEYKNLYSLVLKHADLLQQNGVVEGMAVQELSHFCSSNEDVVMSSHLQVIPELYAEGYSFINDKQTDDGIYVILDIGGGTVDFAVVLLKYEDKIRKVKFLSQSVVPLGVEMLLNRFNPSIQENERSSKKKDLSKEKAVIVKTKIGEWMKIETVRERTPYEFREGFYTKIIEAKQTLETRTSNENLLKEIYDSKAAIPMYVYGGGANYEWYQSIIRDHNSSLNAMYIPNLVIRHRKSNLFRLVIAENLANIRGVVGVGGKDDAVDFDLCFKKTVISKPNDNFGIELAEYGLLDTR